MNFKGNKYHNHKFHGFDSIKEAKRYSELCLLQKAGKISGLDRQVRFELIPAQYEDYAVTAPSKRGGQGRNTFS